MHIKNAILICGGKDKGLPLGDLIKQINSNIKAVYLIGQMSDRFREELLLGGYPNERIFPLVTMENVVKALREKLSGDEKRLCFFLLQQKVMISFLILK